MPYFRQKMIVKSVDQVKTFTAGDLTQIKELLHPDNDGLALSYSLAHATLAAGQASIPHHLKGSEVYYILEGEGLMHIDEASREVKAGDIVFIPPLAAQYIENKGSGLLSFLCIVDPAWRAGEEEIYEQASE